MLQWGTSTEGYESPGAEERPKKWPPVGSTAQGIPSAPGSGQAVGRRGPGPLFGLPLAPSLLGQSVADAAGRAIAPGGRIELARVAVAARLGLLAQAAVLRTAQLAQVRRLDAVLDAASVVDLKSGVDRADKDGVRRDVRPRAAGDLLV